MSDLDYQRDEHHVHLIVYHLIWCPKRRKKVLVNQVGQRCEEPDSPEVRRNGLDDSGIGGAARPYPLVVCGVWPSVSAAE